MIYYLISVQADVEFQARMAARGLNSEQLPEVDKPSNVVTSLESYVKNIISR